MKNLAIAALIFGICLEVLAIFGNRMPYPIVLNIVSPEYVEAGAAYHTLLTDGLLEEGDVGFDRLRDSYMRLTLMAPEPPFPIDEIDGVTITRFRGAETNDPSEISGKSVVAAEFNNGEIKVLDYAFVQLLADGQWSVDALIINCGLLILGCGLVYYGLTYLVLDAKPLGEAEARALILSRLLKPPLKAVERP